MSKKNKKINKVSDNPLSNGHRFDGTPSYIQGELRDYQIAGLNWLINLHENNLNGILADEMGLGKTVQTISLLGYLKHFKKMNGRHLVLVPLSTLRNWENEFQMFCPSIKVYVFYGSHEDRYKMKRGSLYSTAWDVCLTSYETVISEKWALGKIQWKYLIVDEGQRLKNEKAKFSAYLRGYTSENRLLLTGTPLQNNLHELWSLLNFLQPDSFHSSADFDEHFSAEACLTNAEKREHLQDLIKPMILRRIKADVEKSIKPKKEINIYVNLSVLQREWYKRILLKNITKINNYGEVRKLHLQNILMQLRKCANHPYLFDGAEPEPYRMGDHILQASAKMIVLDKLLPKLQEQGSRVLIFSQMTRMLDILEDYCLWRNYEYCRLDGNTSHEDRDRQIQEYNAENSTKFIFMLSTRAGGLGINLATADVVIIYDSDWNPQVDLQAMARAHRIGQKKEVRVFRFITQNTVEEKIVQRAAVKMRLGQMITQDDRFLDDNSNEADVNIRDIIRFGANEIMKSDGFDCSDEDIDQILKRSEEKTAAEKAKINSLIIEPDKCSEGTEGLKPIEPHMFEGKNYRKGRLDLNTLEDCLCFPFPTPEEIEDFQFFPKRFIELLEEDAVEYDLFKVSADQMQVRIKEKSKLYKEGFGSWTRHHFNQFLDAIAEFGRDNIDEIAARVDDKKPEEVIAYSKVFWERCHELRHFSRYMTKIEKGEQRIKENFEFQAALERKLSQYTDPLTELEIQYDKKSLNTNFTKDHDRFLLYTLCNLGVASKDVYSRLLDAAIKHFDSDEYLKSTRALTVRTRCKMLLKLIQAEFARSNNIEAVEAKNALNQKRTTNRSDSSEPMNKKPKN